MEKFWLYVMIFFHFYIGERRNIKSEYVVEITKDSSFIYVKTRDTIYGSPFTDLPRTIKPDSLQKP